jgi:hypothetical protein
MRGRIAEPARGRQFGAAPSGLEREDPRACSFLPLAASAAHCLFFTDAPGVGAPSVALLQMTSSSPYDRQTRAGKWLGAAGMLK